MDLFGVTYSVTDGIARITLARPEGSNSLNTPAAQSLRAAIAAAGADDDVRAVLLDAQGPRFCAGGDLPWVMTQPDVPATLLEMADEWDAANTELAALSKPVVAAVQGAAAGAGLALMLSADVIVAAESTKFVTAYAGVGLTPDCGLSWLLPRAVGQQRALDLLLTGRTLTAAEALEWGLVNRVVPAEDLADAALELATRIAAAAPFAMSQAKRLVRESYASTRAETGADEGRTISAAITTPEAQQKIAAFFSR